MYPILLLLLQHAGGRIHASSLCLSSLAYVRTSLFLACAHISPPLHARTSCSA